METPPLCSYIQKFKVIHDMLFYELTLHGVVETPVATPKVMIQSIIRQNHSTPDAGHMGVRRTTDRIKPSYYWPDIISDVTVYVSRCRLCVMEKGSRFKPADLPVASITTQAKQFNDRVAWDIQGPFRVTSLGNRYILVISDLFSRLAISIAIPDTTAKTVASVFTSAWYGHYGAPSFILSDNGANFKSEVMADTMAILNVRQVFTAPYHPEANGVVERLNRTFTSMMRKFVNDELSNWDIFLPFINRAYNTSIHEVTHASPHYVVFGSNPESIIDRFLSTDGVPSDRTRWGDQMRAAHDRVLSDLRLAQDKKGESIFEASVASEFFTPFAIGDFVWYKKSDLKKSKL
jgi:hypothetical protein